MVESALRIHRAAYFKTTDPRKGKANRAGALTTRGNLLTS
jgi:hypothetical protein